ncbi:CHAT domain-containing tetratricopeptide repeat protein [Pyxidicoccus fallax]|nr:CHAT domain-containing protein [Pyxidicoccus fallax]
MAGLTAVDTEPDVWLLEARSALAEAAKLQQAGRATDAIAWHERALAIQETTLGKDHPDLVPSLNNLARLNQAQGDYAKAGPLFERALTLLEAAHGGEHPAVARALSNLAALYHDQGLYTRARPLLERALAIQQATLGGNHLDVATTLNNLALGYAAQDLHARAEPLHQRALAIQQASLGGGHPEVARTLHHLARLAHRQGLHAQAESLYEQALVIQKEVLGEDHLDTLRTFHALAGLHADQGMYSRAEALYVRAISLTEASLGSHHPETACSLNNLANLHARQGLGSRAMPLYERALPILEASLGENHPKVAGTRNNLALLYSSQRRYEEAESLHLRALAIQEAAFGPAHPDVATSLNNLALLSAEQGEPAQAEQYLSRALDIQQALLGENHPSIAQMLGNLGWLHVAQHRLDEALPLLTRAFALSEQRLRQEALAFSESRLASFLKLLRRDEERLYALLRAHPDDARVQRLALSAVLLRKGRSLEEIACTFRAVYREFGEEDRIDFQQLRDLRTRLASLSQQGPGTRPLAEYQQHLKELTSHADALEAKLARRSAPLRALTAPPSPEDIVDRAAAALPPDGVLVEFIAYADQPLHTGARGASRAPQLHYLALLLFPDASIRVVDLGPAMPIDRAATHLLDVISRRDAAYLRPAQALYSRAFAPLVPHLGGVRRIFLAPDGQLGLVPFTALHDGRRFLLDVFGFSPLTSVKDLLPRADGVVPSTSIAAFADPVSGAHQRVVQAAPRSKTRGASAGARLDSTPGVDPTQQQWLPLPGTRKEAEAIQRLWPQAQVYIGAEATRQRLFALSPPGLLHIGTHGYSPENEVAPDGSRAIGYFGGFGGGTPPHHPADPLLRSGFILADASAPTRVAEGHGAGTRVTALEIASLNLCGTQLVVLSACDTGRGEVQLGQDVYGLRRAFFIAGAETVVVSLWKVNDASTALLMEDFYRRLAAGQGRADALQGAMRTVKKTRPHPYYWAAFMTMGRDGPLQGLASEPPRMTAE